MMCEKPIKSFLMTALLPYYPKGEGRGRPPIGLERMLRTYIAQQCFGLSDEGIEDAIYDSQAIRGFVGIDLTHESAPDATTLLKFRRLLEKHELTRRIFDEINAHLTSKGLMMREGTIVDATLIAAPPSTKNRDEKRDPEMHQSKKGKTPLPAVHPAPARSPAADRRDASAKPQQQRTACCAPFCPRWRKTLPSSSGAIASWQASMPHGRARTIHRRPRVLGQP
jgi:transposase